MPFKKRAATILTLSLVALFLLGLVFTLKSIFLRQIKNTIEKDFDYQSLRVSVFPPVLLIKELRSRSLTPFFSAQKVAVRLSVRSWLTRNKSLNAVIEKPVLRVYNQNPAEGREKGKPDLVLPLSLESGLIKDGEFYFWGKDVHYQAKGINLLLLQGQDRFSLKAESRENLLSFGAEGLSVSGKLSVVADGRHDQIRIRRLRLGGGNYVSAAGTLSDPLNPNFQLETSFKAELPLVASLLNLPFEWDGKADGKGVFSRQDGVFRFKGDLNSRDIVLNGAPLDKITGKLDFDSSGESRLDLNIFRGSRASAYTRILFEGQDVWGTASGLDIDPIIRFIHIPWPVASPVWGNFRIEGGVLTVDGEFRDQTEKKIGGLYPVRGKVHVVWNEETRRLDLRSEEVVTSFASVKVDLRMVEEKELDLTIEGDISDVREARRFTEIILQKKFNFPEIRGRGQGRIHLFGDYWFPQVMSSFSLSPAGFLTFDAANVEGEAEVIKDDFFGRFRVTDPRYSGRVGVISNEKEARADIRLDRGRIETILPHLNVDLPLTGEGRGTFDYREIDLQPSFNGTFSADRLMFLDQPLTNVSGRLEGTKTTFSLLETECDFLDGQLRGDFRVGTIDRNYEIEFQGRGIDLSRFEEKVGGRLEFNLSGKGNLDLNPVTGTLKATDLTLGPLKKTELGVDMELLFLEEGIELKADGDLSPGSNEFHAEMTIPFDSRASVTGNINGFFSNLDLLLPLEGAKGKVNYRAALSLPGTPFIRGIADVEGSILPFPRFPHALRDFAGLVSFEDGTVTLRNFRGKMGGGDLTGSGRLIIGADDVETIDIRAEGRNLELTILERTKALTDADLHLFKDSSRFNLEGEFVIRQGLWRRELDEKLVLSSQPYYLTARKPGFFDDLNLNIRMRADDNILMDNSLGNLRGRFDLTVSGNLLSPVLLGEIEALDGTIVFQDRQFKILRGRISFLNPLVLEPTISFLGETYIKDYRVTFSLDGLYDETNPNRLNPEFNSSPPLPPEDVLALLALGYAFQRTYQYDLSSSQGTASLISFQLSEEAKKRAENLFRLDRFRIDPFVMGTSAEMTARLTLGKKISRNFFILYSTNLAAQRHEITRIEWELSRDLSVVATRNEEGRVSIDVKIHKRFK